MRPAVLSWCLLSCSLVLFGCSDAFSAQENMEIADQTSFDGSVRLPLAVKGTDGKAFKLRNATFEIAGPAMFTLSEKDAKVGAEYLVTMLPAGQYSVFLRPGWELVEIAADGTETNAPATLRSNNPIPLTMGRTVDQRIKFTVETGDRTLLFGELAAVRVTSLEPELSNAL